jgi:uncharacterized membrane protein YphA (DoxX/SURF4 family)
MTEPNMNSRENRNEPRSSRKGLSIALWIVQGLLAALFLFAGVMKLVLPPEELKGPVAFPVLFLRFIGVAELLGGLGLILPGLLRIKPALTPLAAAGLLIIMIGATAISVATGPITTGIVPFVCGLLLLLIAYYRWKVVPHGGRSVSQNGGPKLSTVSTRS